MENWFEKKRGVANIRLCGLFYLLCNLQYKSNNHDFLSSDVMSFTQHKTTWYGEWCIGCSSWVLKFVSHLLCTLKPLENLINLQTFPQNLDFSNPESHRSNTESLLFTYQKLLKLRWRTQIINNPHFLSHGCGIYKHYHQLWRRCFSVMANSPVGFHEAGWPLTVKWYSMLFYYIKAGLPSWKFLCRLL